MVFVTFNNIGLNTMGKNAFVLGSNEFFWLLQGILVGLLISYIVSDYVSKKILRGRYYDFQIFKILTRRQLGTSKELKILAMLSLTLLFISAVVGMHWYARFTKDEIIVRQIFSLKEQRYKYSDIASIKSATHRKDQNEKIKKDFYFNIYFDNGQVLSSEDYMGESEKYYNALLKYMENQSGKITIKSEFITDKVYMVINTLALTCQGFLFLYRSIEEKV